MYRVCIDPGHGAGDNGAVYKGVQEKDLNLSVSKLLVLQLKDRGFDVEMTRIDDANSPSLSRRIRTVNQAHGKRPYDAIISIHCNAAAWRAKDGTIKVNPRSRGLFCIHHAKSGKGIHLSACIANTVARDGMQLRGDGIISTQELGRELAWIHKTQPVATLVELGHMTNHNELLLLQDPHYQDQLAASICKGIDLYLGAL